MEEINATIMQGFTKETNQAYKQYSEMYKVFKGDQPDSEETILSFFVSVKDIYQPSTLWTISSHL